MSDLDARALYDYIEKTIATPVRGQPPARQ